MRVATYTRISTDEEHQPYSLEAQNERLAAYIRSQEGWQLTRQYSDQMTGSVLERPDLQRALSDARMRRFDLLLVYRVDRLSRSVRGLAHLLEDLDHTGVVFRSATEPFDTGTPAGRMMVQMLGVFAEFERATLIDRVVAGMERKAARGGWHGGSPPFGYRVNSQLGILEPDPGESSVVQAIFEQAGHARLGSQSLANWLNARGYRARGEGLWSARTVLKLLRNPVYVGRIVFRGSEHQGLHGPLVDDATFQACQAILDERGEDATKRASNPSEYILTGLLTCGRCGRRMVGAAAHGRYARYRYYTCNRRQRYGKQACPARRVQAPGLEEKIEQALLSTFRDTELMERVAERAKQRAQAERPQLRKRPGAINADIARTQATVDRYLRAFEAGPCRTSSAAPGSLSLASA